MKQKSYIKLYNEYMYLLYFGYNTTDVILLSDIKSLSQNGECRVRDEWFMNLLNIKRSTVQNSLHKMENGKLITKYYDGDVRIIKVNDGNISALIDSFEYSKKLDMHV